MFYKFLDFETVSISSFLTNEFCPLLKKKYSKTHQEIYAQIIKLLNKSLFEENMNDLMDELDAFSMDIKENHSDSNIN